MGKLLKVLFTRQSLGALWGMLNQLGILVLIRTISRAIVAGRGRPKRVGRAFLPSFWSVLGDREALVCDEKSLTFNQYNDRVLRLASGLHALGLQPGDKVAEMLHNGTEWFEMTGAASLMGYPMPMLNWHLSKEELFACLDLSSPRVLVLDSDFASVIQELRERLSHIEFFVVVGQDVPEGMIKYEQLLSEAEPVLPPGNMTLAPSPYSGGTTGTPKYLNYYELDQVLSGDKSKRKGASIFDAMALGLMQMGAFYWYKMGKLHDAQSHNIRSLIPGPLYHAGVQVAVIPFFTGGTAIPMHRFTAELFLETIEKERANWTFVAPTMLERVLGLPEEVQHRYNLSSMRVIICAAAPCAPEVKRRINALFRAQGCRWDVFHEYYGASETGLVTVLAPEDYQDHPERYNSVGKVRAGECRVYDSDSGTWAPPGKSGKVLCRTLMTLGMRYINADDKTTKAYRNVNGVPWYDDGLIGYLDEDGFLYLTSREKEMIICGGVNIYPNEIEEVIKRHPSVVDAAVVRGPDKDLGEIPIAVVQLTEGKQVESEEIISFVRENGLYGFKIPRLVDFVDELPRQLAGKLIKREIEQRYWQNEEQHG